MFARPSSQHKSQVSLQKSGILGTLDLGLHVNRPEDSAWICCLLSIVRKLCSHKFSWITGPKKKRTKTRGWVEECYIFNIPHVVHIRMRDSSRVVSAHYRGFQGKIPDSKTSTPHERTLILRTTSISKSKTALKNKDVQFLSDSLHVLKLILLLKYQMHQGHLSKQLADPAMQIALW